MPTKIKDNSSGSKRTIKFVLIFVVIALVAGLGIFAFLRYQSYESLDKSLQLTFNDDRVFEYGYPIETKSLVKEYTGDLTYEPSTLEGNEVGMFNIAFYVTDVDKYDQKITKKYSTFYEVKDTSAPIITLNAASVSFTAGTGFDPASNIKEVSDVIDGVLTKADTLTKGTYTVSSNVDINTAGSYTVSIQAKDLNGLVTTLEYPVTVTAKQKVYYQPSTPNTDTNTSASEDDD